MATVVYESVGIELIAAERRRQVAVEGYDSAHDDEHAFGEMAIAAAELVVETTDAALVGDFKEDQWGLVARHRRDRIRQLVIAGALVAAEIDRLKRLG